MADNKKMKTIWTIALVALVITIALAITGTVLMFFDYEYVVDFDSMWIGHSRYAPHPQSGVMPFIGTVLLLISLALLIFAKKKPFTAIPMLMILFFAQAVLAASFAMYCGSSLAKIGYWLSMSASCVGVVVFVLAVVYMVFAKKYAPELAEEVGKKPRELIYEEGFAERMQKAVDALRALKELFEEGVITADELATEKQYLRHVYRICEVVESASVNIVEEKKIDTTAEENA